MLAEFLDVKCVDASSGEWIGETSGFASLGAASTLGVAAVPLSLIGGGD